MDTKKIQSFNLGFIIFVALRNTKLLVLEHKHHCKHQQKKEKQNNCGVAAVILLIMKKINLKVDYKFYGNFDN